jgi:hypothetical protein
MPSPFRIGGYAVIEHGGNELTNWEFIKAVLPAKTMAPSYARRHFFWRISAIRETPQREFAEGPLSAATADAHPFPSIVRSAPIPDVRGPKWNL